MGLGETVWVELRTLCGFIYRWSVVALKGTARLLYRWLRIMLFWLWKIACGSVLRVQRWRLSRQQREQLSVLGEHVYGFHRGGQANWSEQNKVSEMLRALELGEQKGRDLEARLRETQERFRQRLARIRGEEFTNHNGSL
jgi:hypothetical protein